MWIFTKDGYFSAVQKDCNADEVLVRSRQKSDLVSLGKKIGIKLRLRETPLSDYRYRTVLKKADWGRYLAEAALNLDYDNFKDTVPKSDFRRHGAYLQCWEALLQWQESSRKGNARNDLSGLMIR
jgi:hypothetical protein